MKDREERMRQLESEQTELLSLHNQTASYLREGEALEEDRSQRLKVVEEELIQARETIEELEALLEHESMNRLKDLDYERAILEDICNQFCDQVCSIFITMFVGGVVIQRVSFSLSQTMDQPTCLETRLAQRDQLLLTVQEETSKLLESHSFSMREVRSLPLSIITSLTRA